MTRARILPPRPKGVRCVSDPNRPHGEGHNKVCVCLCRCCVAERGAATDAQFTLALGGG